MQPDKQKEQLLLALDLARIGFYDWDVKGDSLTYSKFMLEDWGIESPESFPLTSAIERIHPDDQERVNRLIHEAMANHTKYSTEYRVIRPDGTLVWLEVNGVIEYDEKNEPTRFFGTSVNITERKLKEQILADNEQMVRTFLDTMPQMSFIADENGSVLHFNQRWYDYVQFEGAEGDGWKEHRVHHPDDYDRTVATWGVRSVSGTTRETSAAGTARTPTSTTSGWPSKETNPSTIWG